MAPLAGSQVRQFLQTVRVPGLAGLRRRGLPARPRGPRVAPLSPPEWPSVPHGGVGHGAPDAPGAAHRLGRERRTSCVECRRHFGASPPPSSAGPRGDAGESGNLASLIGPRCVTHPESQVHSHHNTRSDNKAGCVDTLDVSDLVP
jgi:hypothetical protein